MAKFIFVTGGVVSSLGKGICAAALGSLLQARGYKVRLRKLDPYINVDPGTMSPYQHGEVFVTEDGAETDLDLGHYERFTGVNAKKTDSTTTGKIYSEVIARERKGDYLGATVQVIPHITDEIKSFIVGNLNDEDFIICEIGGTVGDIESTPFLEAIRQLGNEVGNENVMYLHLTLLPWIDAAGELKTKPTQHSVKELLSIGIQPNLLLCRASREIPENERRKIALFCNVKVDNVIQALDVKSIYEVPLSYHKEGLDRQVLKHFGMFDEKAKLDLSSWEDISRVIANPERFSEIAIVGKYVMLPDAYKSLIEALGHGGIANRVKVKIRFVAAEELEDNADKAHELLAGVDAILVPGGYGERGSEGKVIAAQYARENNIPFLGICFGMQMAVVEGVRSLLNITGATSSEFKDTENSVVGLITEWLDDGELQKRVSESLGGTQRLGSYKAVIKDGTLAREIYGQSEIFERHRHRYEVNIAYKDELEGQGMVFSGMSEDGLLPEIIEYKNHPWFIGVQFHPELKSRPLAPHPLFVAFVKASIKFGANKDLF